MLRDEMIAVLIDDTVERMVDLRQVFWLQEILENGFDGYAQWSDFALRAELERRAIGLDGAGDSADGDSFDDDGGELLAIAGGLGSDRLAGY